MPSYIFGKIELDDTQLQKDLEIVKGFPRISEEYDEFGTGVWINNSLWNASQDATDTMYRDFDYPAKQTEYGRQLPYISKLVTENFNLEYLKMVRTRNLIDGMVIPHKDFVELNKPKNQYFRVFVPLEDNQHAFHSDEDNVFQMKKGEIWFLDAAIDHAAVNFSTESRIFLCLDFAFPGDFHPSEIFTNKALYNELIKPTIAKREQLKPEAVEHMIQSLSQIIDKYNFKDVLFMLSKIHFYKDVPVSAAYDWLEEITRRSGKEELLDKTQKLRKYMIEKRDLGERFSINDWKELTA
ncbi:aspartyl/asparaginyl beta-hydroxylase domain-containing protein [Aneurinibacillus thermoaerophilus]|uniref:Aspartyl/asparaginyl beta-hydroxylase domain-containing protein n=1 Tax=Aneurinibacillus thermoaerophilus TaxID=143495 RepID=A0ABX8YDC4_ANETH|nr:aspartyl/asparaginyl beta-hydroxylase domain-containing protein [Aneurinibacillus thermoaerophilus]QYY43560.1 aspartyl/asparaginyl beta-hydroxylase domain-containing protein [Aneurinibacillus thermoaerophilus]